MTTLEEVLDEDEDEPMIVTKSLMFWKILRYMKTRMKQIVGTSILMILMQADEWNDLQQDTSHTVDSNDNHAGNNNMLK